MSWMTIPTRRLLLRPFESSDGPAFFRYMSDPEVARYNSSPPLSLEEAQESVDTSVAALALAPEGTKSSRFAITLRPQGDGRGELIGHCQLLTEASAPAQAELAYYLNRSFWNQGYTTEAVRALLRYGFEELGQQRIFAKCLPDNAASQRVLEKAGLHAEGSLTLFAADGNFFHGAFQDMTYLKFVITNSTSPCH